MKNIPVNETLICRFINDEGNIEVITKGKILSNTSSTCETPDVKKLTGGNLILNFFIAIVNETQYKGLKHLKKIQINLLQENKKEHKVNILTKLKYIMNI